MIELLRRFGGKFRRYMVIGPACKLIEVIFDLLTPLVIAQMIDKGIGAHDVNAVVRYGMVLGAMAVIGISFTLVCQKMAALTSQGMGTDIRGALYEHINKLSYAELDRFGTPSLITRITNDVNQVQLAVALGVFGAVLAVAGRLPLGPAPLAAAWAGIVLGSLPLYALWLGVALRLGRNAAIGAGAAGMLLAFFSVGGLAHGLMTGELTGALATPLSWVPLAWPARLGSLGVEAFIDAARAAGPLLTTALAGLVLTLAAAAVLLAWFCRFEDGRADA